MRFRALVAALAAAATVVPAASAAPPAVAARAFIVVNTDTGEVLAARRPDTRLPMASTTKMMTAIVVMERANLDDVAVVPAVATGAGGSTASLVAGERLSVRNLVTGLMIGSGNDAAIALARNVGGGSIPRFVGYMNAEAQAMGLTNTHFANPHGLDASGHYSTVRELVVIGRRAREDYPFVAATVSRRVARIPGANGVGTRRLESENDLLSIDPEADGVKTGHTAGAGYAVVAHAVRPAKRMGLYVAIIGSPSRAVRARDAKRLLDWGFRQYARVVVLPVGGEVVRVPVRDRPGVTVPLVPEKQLGVTIRLGAKVTRSVVAPVEVIAPLAKGTVVGKVTITSGENVLGTRNLVVGEDVQEASVTERVRAGVGRLW